VGTHALTSSFPESQAFTMEGTFVLLD